MTIYFAGSIRGGRDDAMLYREIIERLRAYGEVLTEHVGDSPPNPTSAPRRDREIHDEDLAWLEQADVLVAEVTTPSLGVGYEIGRAVASGKPVLCLFRPDSGQSLSAMIAGNEAVEVVHYQDIDQVDALFSARLRVASSKAAAGAKG